MRNDGYERNIDAWERRGMSAVSKAVIEDTSAALEAVLPQFMGGTLAAIDDRLVRRAVIVDIHCVLTVKLAPSSEGHHDTLQKVELEGHFDPDQVRHALASLRKARAAAQGPDIPQA